VTQEIEAQEVETPSDDVVPDEAAGRPPGSGAPGGGIRMPAGPNRMMSFGMPLERSSDPRATILWLLGRFRREKWVFLVAVVASVCGVVLTVFGPRLLGEATNIVVDGLQHGGPAGIDFQHLHRVLFEVVALYVGGASLQYFQAYLMAGVVQRTMRTLRSDIEDKLHRLPLSHIDRAARGDLLSRVTNDIDNLGQSLQQTISQLLTNVFMLIGTVVMMFVISPVLAVVALVTIPLSAVIIRFIMARARPRFRRQWAETGTLDAFAEESLTGHAIVKTFGRQNEVQETFFESNERLFRASFEAQYISSSVQPAIVWIGNLNFVAIAVIGGLQVANGSLSIGGVQAFIQYSRQFSQPLQMLASMFNLLLSGLASAERVSEVLLAAEQTPDPAPVAEPEPAWRGRVEFEHVDFSYDPSRPLITDLSMIAQPGTTVAIVGPTGAGKTTLVNLIMRFYELDGGRITLDGVDIATMPRAQLRANVGMVLQDTWLFSGTIRENIAYGNPDATEEQILAAARATYVDRFVHSLSDGYDTVVDDDSGALSAGEKQLLTIARAFLADPTILILDEATSSVDTRTEVLIQDAMAALRSQRTSFVIAHRLSTIRNADTILVMNEGRIVEHGNHDELLTRGGAYADLYNAQFAGAAVDLD
jgi:ATP-binding cassette subfamily B protein